MAAAATDKFTKVGSPGTATTLDSPGHTIGGTSITVISTSNWPTSTGVIFAMDTVTLVDGVEVRDVGTYTEWEGVVASATSITGLVLREGSDQNYPAGSTTRVYIPVAGSQNDRMVDGLIQEHNQDGTHSAITATSITATTGTFTNFTITGTASSEGWSPLGATPNTITANGNRSYDIVFNSVDKTSTVSPGMRLKLTRTVTAPTGSITLNGTTQYLSKSSPSGMTGTDNYTWSAWVNPSSYATGTIQARMNTAGVMTDGWKLEMTSAGQLTLLIRNAGAANYKSALSYQSLPLNKWSHVAVTWATGTALVYIDGVSVPFSSTSNGTAPNTWVATGDYTVGRGNSAEGFYFPGQLAQVSVFSAVLSAATIKAMATQTHTGSETNVISAYKLDQASGINDLASTANNLTANGSPSYSTTKTPFTQDVTGTSVTAGTTNYAIITKASFSTNTTLTVQVPEGDTIPTSGGVSAVSYSTQKVPYGFPAQRGKWPIITFLNSDYSVGTTANTWYGALFYLTIPTGDWSVTYNIVHNRSVAATAYSDLKSTLSTTTSTETDAYWTDGQVYGVLSNALITRGAHTRTGEITTTSQTPYYGLVQNASNNSDTQAIGQYSRITAYPAHL